MQRFDWSIEAFNQFARKGDSWKLQIEEAEDEISMGIERLKGAKTKAPDSTSEQVEQIVSEFSATLDKLRKLRTNMKSMV